jgi:transcriptional regulator with XRE-family HTH domain
LDGHAHLRLLGPIGRPEDASVTVGLPAPFVFPGRPSDEAQAPGSWLRQQREAAGLTQEDLAEQSGLSVRAIGNLERGRVRRPRPDSLRLVGTVLGLTEHAVSMLIARYRVSQRDRSVQRPASASGAGDPARSVGEGGRAPGPAEAPPESLVPATSAHARLSAGEVTAAVRCGVCSPPP